MSAAPPPDPTTPVPLHRSSFLVLHGWENRRPPGHWQHLLAEGLTEAGAAQVLYPQLPDPDEPDVGAWLGEMRRHAATMTGEHRVLVCHSLAVLAWWTAALSGEPIAADRVLLVAPPAPNVLRSTIVHGFVPDLRAGSIDRSVLDTVRLVGSDDDPYCPAGARAEYGDRYVLDTDMLSGQGHLDLTAGYGAWPSVLAWCADPAVRITAR